MTVRILCAASVAALAAYGSLAQAATPAAGETLADNQTFTYRELDEFPTIDPNLTKLGQLAASRLLTAIDGGKLGSGLILQSCDLVIRQSSVSQ